MIYKILSIRENDVVAEFYTRIDALGYIRFNDPESIDLFYKEFKTKEDFPLYLSFIEIITIISIVGMSHFC